jgi:hypothetical protein
MQPTCRSFKRSHGSRPSAETRFTLLPTRLPENCYTRSTCRRRTCSKRPARRLSWRSTVEKSTSSVYQRSYCLGSRSNVSFRLRYAADLADILDVEYSRTGELIKGQDKPKVRSRYDEDGKLLCIFTDRTNLTISPAQQPQGSMGILVRPRIRSMGFRMLSLYQYVPPYFTVEFVLISQSLGRTVLEKLVLQPTRHFRQTPSSNPAKSTTVFRPPQKLNGQPRPKSYGTLALLLAEVVARNARKRSAGPDPQKARRLSSTSRGSGRLSMRRRRGRI